MPRYNFIKYVTQATGTKAALRIAFTDTEPVLSAKNIEDHYTVLYKKYLDNAVDDPTNEFAVAGALLHRLFFEQLIDPSMSSPQGISKEIIDKNFNNFIAFKHMFIEEAMGIQGSGWTYMDTSGKIQTISNHKVVDDVAMIIDCWEHSYYSDYGPNKEDYLNNIWKLIDWDVVNARLTKT